MLFNSVEFAVFLPIVFILYWALPHKFRWVLLLVSSYYFYMSWNAKYVFLILFTTLLSYLAARLIDRAGSVAKKKWVLAGTAVLCLGVLFFFKYFNFVSQSVIDFLDLFALRLSPVTLSILLPVGISFYTFQTLSYVIDVYRGNVKAERHFGYYATFISFFPQLVAGPIERTVNLLPQIKAKQTFDYDQATYGLKLMAWGFFKKLAVADVVAQYVDAVYASPSTATGFDLVIAVFFFTVQIYCDFSGYSDIAIGTSKLMGIELMTNFRSPYFARSIKEFWSRWHISLSTWFKDYVYIPLGGNRCSKLRHSLNLVITFLVSGLWHGASWTYVIWGGIHGVAQVVENWLFKPQKQNGKIKSVIAILSVFVFCNVTWIFFRAETLSDALYVISHIFLSLKTPGTFLDTNLVMSVADLIKILLAIVLLGVYDFASLKTDVIRWISDKNKFLRWTVYLLLVLLIVLYMPGEGASEFVYFQF